uniref:Coatomer WD associated region domain-containing protein n=1 Tax=Aegilops tauschii subsp. strangulata TaxID=200361 RepID=A0A453TEC8_AEGTS
FKTKLIWRVNKDGESINLTSLIAVSIVKFIARKKWIVVVTAYYLHVYDYACVTKIEKIQRVGPTGYSTDSPILAVHPTLPSVLSMFYTNIVVLDIDLGWKRTQKISIHDDVRTISLMEKFNM